MTTTHLNPSQTWSADPHQASIVIRVEAGTIWVTQEGDGEDHVLIGPASLTTRPEGRVALQAFTAADVEFTTGAPDGLRRAA